ncbi:hypothetical protein P153DRAFT_56436 [Dothidotthia symphoricarpi CBS 119687]|uniref:Mitochondrial K+-H+ exchange-related-domain-containing protein n=1 Tax=Dothidotthia symphoricarpi CBS 119687 TaxID=1392245 RepID=A0A6A6AAE5_9PLEO|nr:uncharacterized protein P153DRAFT_56436 [Dothidotthia symphoricarpi CBS 119687]KAF2127817.1 hypothetical protein P153DRAFT_56436 [Dothidotthia symphoricarpi CBS 119687]
MRLFLLPISRQRSLLYCEKLHEKAPAERSYLDKLTIKADSTWSAWEKDTASTWNWKQKTTHYGNQLLKRIPYEEWGLKTMPALSAARKQAILDGNGKERLEVVFPGAYIEEGRVRGLLEKLARERQGMHRSKLMWSVIIMPFTAPFMLVPIVPNLPFFYVLYRAYSHWKALTGSKHLDFLLQHNVPKPSASPVLDALYTAGLLHPTRALALSSPPPTAEQITSTAHSLTSPPTTPTAADTMLLQRWNGKLIAEKFDLPDMEVEIERAVEQVRDAVSGKAVEKKDEDEVVEKRR